MHEPKNYLAIMVSSTFTDIEQHRQKVIKAIQDFGCMPKVMEHSGAVAGVDVIESSLNMVRDSAAYVGVISLKYGQTPFDPDRNRNRASITELEFDEAMRLNRPILLFIMSEKHLVRKEDVESDPVKIKKLDAFRKRAKRMRRDSKVERVYQTFHDLEQFSHAATVAVGLLVRSFDQRDASHGSAPTPVTEALAQARAFSNITINVPRHFLGRVDDLAAIDAALKGDRGRGAIAALHGLRGVGKTTLAAAYAVQRRGYYRATWWIRAETVPTMRGDLFRLGVRLGWIVADEMEDPALALERLRDEGDHILLVYDNANNADEIGPWIPHGGAAHIIVTSNAPNWDGIAVPVKIEKWSNEVGADYLVAQAGRPLERDAALALSAALDGLPLAHEQAAAYCAETGLLLTAYRKKFEEEPTKFLEKGASQGYHNRRTAAKTFGLAIEEAAKLHRAAEPLIAYAALLAPEPVPLYLFSEAAAQFGETFAAAIADDGLDEAVAALRTFALIDRVSILDERDSGIATDCIRLHRLVREVAAARWNKGSPGQALNREKALGSVVAALDAIYPKDVRQSSRVWRLFPHVVKVLETLVKDPELKARESLDKLTRLVIMALRVTEDQQRAGNLIPDYLATVLGEFYEVELLKKPIGFLLENHREAWPGLQQQFLSTNNYVLRYAMAHALADANRKELPLATTVELAALVMNAKTVNEFELGGYALDLVYARDPGKIDPAVLAKLAERREYCGRSILGDLFLKLVFRKDERLNLRELADSDRFWKPVWDFIKGDIRVIEAAEYFLASPRRDVPEDCFPETKQEFENLVMIEAGNAEFLRRAWRSEPIVKIIDGYFSLGQDTGWISEAEDEFANLQYEDLREIMRLLFAHPIWAVAEAAATMLSLLVENDEKDEKKLIGIVSELLESPKWRVRYGACEAACILSDYYPEIFYYSVQKFHADANCTIRGLCAENLFSLILNTGSEARQSLIEKFKKEIHCWLVDEDCWVLEHVFRFFQTLDRRHALDGRHLDVEKFFAGKRSRLLAGAEMWYRLERGQFLLHIERRKEELVNS